MDDTTVTVAPNPQKKRAVKEFPVPFVDAFKKDCYQGYVDVERLSMKIPSRDNIVKSIFPQPPAYCYVFLLILFVTTTLYSFDEWMTF